MSNNDKPETDTETILLALDQISQTIDVMTSVVGRLRTYMREQEAAAARGTNGQAGESRPLDEILH